MDDGPQKHAAVVRLEVDDLLVVQFHEARIAEPAVLPLGAARRRGAVVGGHLGGGWVRSFAKERGVDLERSFVYSASGDDGLLLSAFGHACAVTPDRALRRLARDNGWPVVEA